VHLRNLPRDRCVISTAMGCVVVVVDVVVEVDPVVSVPDVDVEVVPDVVVVVLGPAGPAEVEVVVVMPESRIGKVATPSGRGSWLDVTGTTMKEKFAAPSAHNGRFRLISTL